MGDKRKKTADGKTPPSKSRPGRKPKTAPAPALCPVAAEAPPAMGLSVLKPTTQPAPKEVAVVPAPPPASGRMVTHHQAEDGGGLLPRIALARGAVAVSAAEGHVVKLLDFEVPSTVLGCGVCHGPLTLPIYQCSLQRHVACRYCGAGKCRPCADLGDVAFYVRSSYLDTLFDYFKLPCLYNKHGCASAVAYRDAAAHAASCAFEPCSCPDCSFEGSPVELARHLSDKAGKHAWPVRNITYGSDQVFVVNVWELNQKDAADESVGLFLLVAEDDGGVFLLAVGRFINFVSHHVNVLHVGRNAGREPVYSSSVMVEGPPAKVRRRKMEKKAVTSYCPVPVEFDSEGEPECDAVVVYPDMLHGKEMHLRIRIDKI